MNKDLHSPLNCNPLSEDQQHNPRISIFIRFEPQMKNKGVLEKILADRVKEEEAELLNQYPEEMVKPVIKKVQNLIKGIKNETHESIAIFVCPVSEKVIYFTYNSYLSEFNKSHPLRPLKLTE